MLRRLLLRSLRTSCVRTNERSTHRGSLSSSVHRSATKSVKQAPANSTTGHAHCAAYIYIDIYIYIVPAMELPRGDWPWCMYSIWPLNIWPLVTECDEEFEFHDKFLSFTRAVVSTSASLYTHPKDTSQGYLQGYLPRIPPRVLPKDTSQGYLHGYFPRIPPKDTSTGTSQGYLPRIPPRVLPKDTSQGYLHGCFHEYLVTIDYILKLWNTDW